MKANQSPAGTTVRAYRVSSQRLTEEESRGLASTLLLASSARCPRLNCSHVERCHLITVLHRHPRPPVRVAVLSTFRRHVLALDDLQGQMERLIPYDLELLVWLYKYQAAAETYARSEVAGAEFAHSPARVSCRHPIWTQRRFSPRHCEAA